VPPGLIDDAVNGGKPQATAFLLFFGRRALPSFHNLIRAIPQGISVWEAAEDTLSVTENDGQQVVEVMSHATGQTAHRLQLLGLLELGFDRLALGDVDEKGKSGRSSFPRNHNRG